MIRKSTVMLTNTGTQWNIIGAPVPGNAYFSYTDGMHTVQVIHQNFVGGIGIQATLAVEPTTEDWFWVPLTPDTTDYPYKTFPVDIHLPTGSNGGDTGSFAVTLTGNFVYLRAVVIRDYLPPSGTVPTWQTWQYGQIDKVLLSM